MGVICSIAQTIPEFIRAIREGQHGISNLPVDENRSVRIGALVKDFVWQGWVESLKSNQPDFYTRARKVLKNTTESTRLSAYAAIQAVWDAGFSELGEVADEVGLIVAGSNLAQDYMVQNWLRFWETGRPNPRYALSFLDSNQVGCLSEILSIRGPGFTIGAAAASGNAALFQALHWIRSGIVRRCIIVGACLELTALELEEFSELPAPAVGRTTRHAPVARSTKGMKASSGAKAPAALFWNRLIRFVAAGSWVNSSALRWFSMATIYPTRAKKGRFVLCSWR